MGLICQKLLIILLVLEVLGISHVQIMHKLHVWADFELTMTVPADVIGVRIVPALQQFKKITGAHAILFVMLEMSG